MLLPSVGLLFQRTCRESPAWAPFLPLQTGCLSAASPVWGSPCGLPERSQGKETARECQEWAIPRGRAVGEQPPQGFLPGSPHGEERCAACAYLGCVGQRVLLLLRPLSSVHRAALVFLSLPAGDFFSYFLLHNIVHSGLHKRSRGRCCSLQGFRVCS